MTNTEIHDNDITVRQIGLKGADWLVNQAVPAVLLACILIFMAFREIKLQPVRDQLQREAYEKIQKDGQLWYETMMEKSYEDNERWRTAILSARGLSIQQDFDGNYVLKPQSSQKTAN